jgi:hypothetical protein
MATWVQVICGSTTIPWNRLVIADLERLSKHPNSPSELHFEGMFPLILQLPMSGKQHVNRLYSLLEALRLSCYASDPRDMVSAILGLVDAIDDPVFAVDYELTVEEVYNRTAMLLARQYNTLDFLSQAGTCKADVGPGIPITS